MAEPQELNRSPYSDGFRTPTPAMAHRWPFSGGTEPSAPLVPPAGRPPARDHAAHVNVPCYCAFLRAATPGAPPVGFPDEARTRGKLQPSGRAWGRFGSHERERIGPRLNLPAHYGP